MAIANITGNILTDSGIATSSLLPLSGGTLTGALNGTTATFSGLGTFYQLTMTGATAGRLFYAQTGGVFSQSGNLVWDNTNEMLGVGTPNPSALVTAFSTNAATQFKAAGTAPAFTFSNTLTSASLACVFGLATANNHFVTGTAAGDMAIANQSTSPGAIIFGTGTFEKMRMSSSGYFGIGTSSPSNLLHVSSTSGALIKLQGSSTGNNTNSIQGVNAGGHIFELGIANAGYSSGIYPAIQANGAYLYGANTLGFISENGNILFQTAASERMRITSGGKLLVRTTTSTGGAGASDRVIEANGNIFSKGSDAGYFWEDRSNSANFYGWYSVSNTIYLFNGSANAASISPSTGVYTPLSDINKKKDFENSTIGLSAILNLKPTLYRMKDDETNGNKELGFIAQEVKDFIPQAYVESDEFIGLNYNAIVAALVKAIQEQQAQIEELKELIKNK